MVLVRGVFNCSSRNNASIFGRFSEKLYSLLLLEACGTGDETQN